MARTSEGSAQTRKGYMPSAMEETLRLCIAKAILDPDFAECFADEEMVRLTGVAALPGAGGRRITDWVHVTRPSAATGAGRQDRDPQRQVGQTYPQAVARLLGRHEPSNVMCNMRTRANHATSRAAAV